MEKFSALLALCAGNWPVNSPHKGQWRRALMFSKICAWINGWVNNRDAGDLRRHRARYDVIVMILLYNYDDRSSPVAKKRNDKLRIPVKEGTQIFFQEQHTNKIICASIFFIWKMHWAFFWWWILVRAIIKCVWPYCTFIDEKGLISDMTAFRLNLLEKGLFPYGRLCGMGKVCSLENVCNN